MNSIGRNIKRQRELRDLTQDELAERIGRSRSLIAIIENNYKDPSLDVFILLGRALNCSLDDLVNEEVRT